MQRRLWVGTTWVTDRLDPQRPPAQPLVMVTVLASLVLAAALPHAFSRYGLIFAGVYVAINIGRLLVLVLAIRGHGQLQRVHIGALVWAIGSAVPWIAGGACPRRRA